MIEREKQVEYIFDNQFYLEYVAFERMMSAVIGSVSATDGSETESESVYNTVLKAT